MALVTEARFAAAQRTAKVVRMPSFTQADLERWMARRAQRRSDRGPFKVVVTGTDYCAGHILQAVMPGIKAVAPRIEFVEKPIASEAFRKSELARDPKYWERATKEEIWDAAFPEDTWRAMYEADAILFGSVGDPQFDHDGIPGPLRPQYSLLRLRKGFDLFANFRPGIVFPALRHLSPLKAELLKGVGQIMVIRELTSGVYYGEPRGYIRERSREGDRFVIELSRTPTGEAMETMYYSEEEAERVMRVAFEYARSRREKLSMFHKANALPSVGGLWVSVFNRLKKEYSDVAADDYYVDIGIANMVSNPRSFGVIVTSNLFGDIAGDVIGAVVGGSVGLVPSAGIGDGVWPAYFEPVHGSAPKRFPKSGLLKDSIVDPTAAWLSAAMMLEHLGLEKEGAAMRLAVELALDSGLRNYKLFRNLSNTRQLGLGIRQAVTVARKHGLGNRNVLRALRGERKVNTVELANAFADNTQEILEEMRRKAA